MRCFWPCSPFSRFSAASSISCPGGATSLLCAGIRQYRPPHPPPLLPHPHPPLPLPLLPPHSAMDFADGARQWKLWRRLQRRRRRPRRSGKRAAPAAEGRSPRKSVGPRVPCRSRWSIWMTAGVRPSTCLQSASSSSKSECYSLRGRSKFKSSLRKIPVWCFELLNFYVSVLLNLQLKVTFWICFVIFMKIASILFLAAIAKF